MDLLLIHCQSAPGSRMIRSRSALYSEPLIGLERSHDKWEWIPLTWEQIPPDLLPIHSQERIDQLSILSLCLAERHHMAVGGDPLSGADRDRIRSLLHVTCISQSEAQNRIRSRSAPEIDKISNFRHQRLIKMPVTLYRLNMINFCLWPIYSNNFIVALTLP